MGRKLDVQDMKNIFVEIQTIMEEQKDYLCELDGALGDGDIGLTVTKGFKSIAEETGNMDVTDIGLFVKKSGFTLAEVVPSTIGTILASALMQAGKALKEKEELDTSDVALFFKGMIEGIRKRGKAELGDKTILDALYPAVDALEESANQELSLEEAASAAYQKAMDGAENTKNLQSKHGRAERYFEKSIGHQDPGATVGALVVKGFDVYLNKG
ncbi:dihydroxyacetone kinase subunit DhaL [Oceanobacillus locisalsi]|uniref:Dihydroxyacetone kinase subunit DhaL n=1 Tax=Oceanobacillus locisalsi TaxID=546107 RepID=A0ABW3NA26_9BACI